MNRGVSTNNYDIVRLLTLQAENVVSRIESERDANPVPARKKDLNRLIKKLEAVVAAAEAAEEFMDGDV